MNIQSVSIQVPAGCPNKCKFCVARLHPDDKYINQFEKNVQFRHLYRSDYKQRLEFARDNGCNTMIYTGDGEPLYNPEFLEKVAEINKGIRKPFRWIEIQSSGVGLNDEKLRWLRNEIEVSTISLSLSSLENDINAEYNVTPEKLKIDIYNLCKEIKRYDFNLRVSLNLTNYFNNYDPEEIVLACKRLGANQITFRVLYQSYPKNISDEQKEINKWIHTHCSKSELNNDIRKYIKKAGNPLEILPFGATRYSIYGMSVVIDNDCMSEDVKHDIKYLILRPNCKLYTKWDDEGSILF